MNIVISNYVKKTMNDLNERLHDCIATLKIAEHNVYCTKAELHNMLDGFLRFEENYDYEETIFCDEMMEIFLDKVREIAPEVLKIREDLPHF
jgi:hypothetical protein